MWVFVRDQFRLNMMNLTTQSHKKLEEFELREKRIKGGINHDE